MGHETCVITVDGKLSKAKAVAEFLDRIESICDCDRPRLSPNSFKECYISATTHKEVDDAFDKVISDRYFSGAASIAKVALPNEEKAFKSKAYQKLQEKLKELRQELTAIERAGFVQIKEKKTKKCSECGSTFLTESLRSHNCPNCRSSLLAKGIKGKISKLNDKMKALNQKQEDLVNKQPKKEQWIIGIEYHT
jgi:DNA-directed RNA polymerase subunit RPC12/RpoP